MRSLRRRESTSICPVCVSITGRRTGNRSGFSGSFRRGSTCVTRNSRVYIEVQHQTRGVQHPAHWHCSGRHQPSTSKPTPTLI
jgi:hypothetical protein